MKINAIDSFVFAEREHAEEMFEQPVHAGIGCNSEEMHIFIFFNCAIDGGVHDGVVEELAVANLFRDRDRFLIDDSARADVLMTNLAVAHRALRQTDVKARGVYQCAGIIMHQRVGDGMFREHDGVGGIPFCIGIFSASRRGR